MFYLTWYSCVWMHILSNFHTHTTGMKHILECGVTSVYALSWSWHYLSTSVEPSSSFPFFHNSRFFEYFSDQRHPVHIHKPCFSKKRIFTIVSCIVPVLAANLLFLYFSPMCLSSIFPPGFPSVLYSYVPFLYYPPVHSFCVIFLYAFLHYRPM